MILFSAVGRGREKAIFLFFSVFLLPQKERVFLQEKRIASLLNLETLGVVEFLSLPLFSPSR